MGLARFPFSASVDGAEGPVHSQGGVWDSWIHMLILTGSCGSLNYWEIYLGCVYYDYTYVLFAYLLKCVYINI